MISKTELIQRAALAMADFNDPDEAWARAEAFVAEGERRGHVQNSESREAVIGASGARVDSADLSPGGGSEEPGTISSTGYKYPPAEEVTRYVVKITRRQESLVPLEDYEAAYRAQVERETEARTVAAIVAWLRKTGNPLVVAKVSEIYENLAIWLERGDWQKGGG